MSPDSVIYSDIARVISLRIIIIIIIIKLVKAPNSTCSSLLTTNQTNVKKRKREQTEWSTSDLEGDESMTAEHRVCWDVHFFVGECVLG